MTIRTICTCDGCGKDLTEEPRLQLASDFKDCPAKRADDYIEPDPKHFCDLICASKWGVNVERTRRL
jgi:hypothetical protein